jgi:hypothetical protein
MPNVKAHTPNISVREQSIIIPTLTANSAYAANNLVGGKQTLSSILLSPGGTATLNDLVVTDIDNQKAELQFLFYSQPITIAGLDKTTPVLKTDLPNLIGQVEITAASYFTLGSDSMAVAQLGGITKLLFNTEATPTQNIYFLVLTSGTPTWTTSSSLTWIFHWSEVF